MQVDLERVTLALENLRRHEIRSADNSSGSAGRHIFRNRKSQNSGIIVVINEDILRLDITANDKIIMQILNR